jgi:histidinol dehydrogenase
MRVLNYSKTAQLYAELTGLRQKRLKASESVTDSVNHIIERVRVEGDAALIEFASRFDGVCLTQEELTVSPAEMVQAEAALSAEKKAVLEEAARRIKAFHINQREHIEQTWYMPDEPGIRLGQVIRPLERAGLYVPGGKAVYPSSVLMNAIPATAAGVEEIIICSPPDKSGGISPYILYAARIAGVNRIYKAGGAQAVAAMAYGTKTIPKVDKIVGPGNIYVAIAKRLVSDCVGIDMFAGPSEVLIIADESANPVWVAADLIAQAEHDADAQPILVTTSVRLAEKVNQEQKKQLRQLSDEEYSGLIQANQSLDKNGIIIIVPDNETALELANRLAPEHLQLMLDKPFAWVDKIRHAGAVFIGAYTPTAIGDYLAGPNHVLPTAGAARFASPLGVYDFIKRTSVVYYDRQAWARQGETAVHLARMEGLKAHARAIEVRLGEGDTH